MCELDMTQEQLDEIIKERVKREKVKYAQLESEHTALAAERDTLNTELTTAREGLEELTNLKRSALVTEVATAKEIPAKFWGRLVGTTKEELEADADKLLEDLGQQTPANKKGVPLTPRGGGEPKPGTARQRIAKRMRDTDSSRTS